MYHTHSSPPPTQRVDFHALKLQQRKKPDDKDTIIKKNGRSIQAINAKKKINITRTAPPFKATEPTSAGSSSHITTNDLPRSVFQPFSEMCSEKSCVESDIIAFLQKQLDKYGTGILHMRFGYYPADTLIHYAAGMKKPDCVEFLLLKGGSELLSIFDSFSGRTPVHHAVQPYDLALRDTSEDKQRRTLEVLVEAAGPNIDLLQQRAKARDHDKNPQTPLEMAKYYKNEVASQILTKAGVKR